MSKKLADPQNQLKDFFRTGEYEVKKWPINPYNIKWLIENHGDSLPLESKNILLEEVEKHIQLNKLFLDKHSKSEFSLIKIHGIQEILFNEDFVAKRLEDLATKGVSIEKESISITRYGSLTVLKKAIEHGFDINYYHKGNYPLRYAYMRKKDGVADYLWDLEGIKKDYIDKDGKNILHILINKNQFPKIIECWEKHPELFFNTHLGKNAMTEIIQSHNWFSRIPKKYKEDIDDIIANVLKFYYQSSSQDDKNTWLIIQSQFDKSNNYSITGEYLKNIYAKALAKSLDERLEKKEERNKSSFKI